MSALVFGGTPKRLLDLSIDGDIDVAVSEAILAETTRVLREKFGWSAERTGTAEALLRSFTRLGPLFAMIEIAERGSRA